MDTNLKIDLEAGNRLKLPPSITEAMSTRPTSNEDENLTHFQNLVKASITDDPKLAHSYISFNVLHKVVLLNHQHKLSLHVRNIVRDKNTTEEQIKQIDEDLHSYRT